MCFWTVLVLNHSKEWNKYSRCLKQSQIRFNERGWYLSRVLWRDLAQSYILVVSLHAIKCHYLQTNKGNKREKVYCSNTFPAPLPFSPVVIVLSCKNGDEIIRRETADNLNDAILNHVQWEIVCEGLGYRTEGVGYKKFPEVAE